MNSAAIEIRELAWSLGINVNDVEPTRIATPRTQTDRTVSAQKVRELAEAIGELPPSGETGERSHFLRSQNDFPPHLRGPHFEHYVEHESAHAAVAIALGWKVKWCDALRGDTKVEFPDYQSHSLADRNLIFAVIAASGAAGTGVSDSRYELEGDRKLVRQRGFTRWEGAWKDARAMATELLNERYTRDLRGRLVDALLKHGRLEGALLQRAIDG